MFSSKLKIGFLFSLIFVSPIFAARNASRYLPFLERPEEYVTQGKSHVYPALFITSASTAFRSMGGNGGIPELWGMYNLKNVISSVAAARKSVYNPFANEPGYTDFNEKDLRFSMNGKIKSRGLILSAEKVFSRRSNWLKNFSAGFFIPLMIVNTSMRFSLDKENSHADARSATDAEVDLFDRVRRKVHNDLGLKDDNWSKTGLGDLDLHIGWRRYFDHVLKMRSIDLNLRGGLLVPTSQKRDKNFPSSIPFMGNGHWGIYGDLVSEFELKQNWKLGVMFALIKQFDRTYDRRIPYLHEPPMFSALSGNVKVDRGITAKASTYFTLENLMDGLHSQFRYTFLRHCADVWDDKRDDKSVKSYLESTDSNAPFVRSTRKYMSRWKYHYITLEVIYDSVEAMRNWFLKPKIYAILDYAFTGRGVSKTHQFTIGAQFHF
jgi:hypothetical protein